MQLTETFFDLIFLVAARSLRSLDCRRQYPAAELTHQRFILCTGSFPAVKYGRPWEGTRLAFRAIPKIVTVS